MPRTSKPTTTDAAQTEIIPTNDGMIGGLVKNTGTGLALPQQEAWFDPSAPAEADEKTIQFVKLTQHTSEAAKNREAEPGDLVTSTGINLGKHATIIPLWRQRQAALFQDNALVCKSFDGITGDTYGDCASCEFNYKEWTTGPNGERVKPACQAQLSFPSILVSSDNFEDGTEVGVVAFQFASTSYAVGKQIVTFRSLKGLPYYGSKWHIASKVKPFKKGSANVYTARFGGSVDRDVMLLAQEMCASWANVKVEISDSVDFADEDTMPDVTPESPPVASDPDEIPF